MFTLNCKGRLLVIDKPLVMGIINVTPDSFYENSRKQDIDEVLRKAEQMMEEGATILDIGGQSTRPGSEEISEDEEKMRVLPKVEAVNNKFPEAFISVDTYRAFVAKEAVAAGAAIINDISSGTFDTNMISTVASTNCPYVSMHIKGTPKTMQQYAVYEDIATEVIDFFINKIEQCNAAGIKDVIIDPGFGFAKNITQNFQLLKKLEVLSILGKPVLIGLSRKSTIYKTLNTSAENALNGTTVMHTLALSKGASILRVHDVKEAVEAVTLFSAFNQA